LLDRDSLAIILDQTLGNGADFVEIYTEEKRVSNVFCESNQIERINSGREKGAGVRVIKDDCTSYVYTNDVSLKGLLKAASIANRSVGRGFNNKPPISLSMKKAEFAYSFKRMPEEVDFAEKISAVLKANQAARDIDQEIRQVTVAVGDIHKRIQIVNSEGDWVEDEIARVRLMVQAVAARHGEIQTGYEVAGGVMGWELLDMVSLDDMAVKASQRAVTMLSAKAAPVGQMPIVMDSAAGGTMVHEACGHGLEADLVQKELSVYRGKVGHRVAAEEVSVIDDATLPGKYGSYRWDDEAIPGQRKILIDRGYLRSFLYDRLTAMKDGTISTGNGRRESYQDKPVVRMSNTFIAPGNDKPDKIIRETERGLLIKKMGGGQVNTTNGDFVFEVQEGYLIEQGETTVPVRGATLIGNGPQALLNIDRVGDDIGFAIGVCGKDGQGVSVADAQPTIRIKALTVGGTSLGKGPEIKRILRK